MSPRPTKLLLLVLLAAIILPASAAVSMDISITISGNDIVKEDFSVDLSADDGYGSFEFSTYQKPFRIIYDGEYTMAGEEGNYTITFYRDALAGQPRLEYSLLYDSLVERSGAKRYFMTSFELPTIDTVRLALNLPAHYILSGQPSAIPYPGTITSDGRSISLQWNFERQNPSIAVAYESEDSTLLWVIIICAAAIILLAAALVIFLGSRRKTKRLVYSALSPEEQAVLGEAKKGETRQNKIAEQLGYSKSKMSKVVRKLEEKGLLEKKPFFKTNKLEIKKI